MSQLSQKQTLQLQDLLSYLDHCDPSTAENKRNFKRSPLRVSLQVTLLTSQAMPSIKVFCRNLSVSGMGFVNRREFHKGEYLVVHLNVPNQPLRLLLGRTMFCRYLRGGLYEVGLEFQDVAQSGETKIPTAWTAKIQGAVLRPVR